MSADGDRVAVGATASSDDKRYDVVVITLDICPTCTRIGQSTSANYENGETLLAAVASLEILADQEPGPGRDWTRRTLQRCPECRTFYERYRSVEYGGFMEPGHDFESIFRLTPHRALSELAGKTEVAAIAAHAELLASLTDLLDQLAILIGTTPPVNRDLRRYARASLVSAAIEMGRSELLDPLYDHQDPATRIEAVDELLEIAWGYTSDGPTKERAARLIDARTPMPVLAGVLREPVCSAASTNGDATTTHKIAFRLIAWAIRRKLPVGDELFGVLSDGLADPMQVQDATATLQSLALADPDRAAAIRARLAQG